mmetsp:Transcript_143330/g.399557  ORF Transcript_143330/g.399557 Transcript_143330/m.399557 type:complete len:418 (+) Transcript_143330:1003-2256(+)
MVPADDLQVHATLLDRGPEVVAHKVTLLLGIEEAVLPTVGRTRLVLHGKGEEREAGLLQMPRKLHEVPRPRLAALGQEFATVEHVASVLHPPRGAPGAGEEHQRPAHGGDGPPDHGENGLVVPRDAEALELHVVLLLAAAPVAPREVAGVHVQATDPVAEAHIAPEVRVNNALLVRGAHALQQLGGTLCEGTSETRKGLVPHARVQDDGDLALAWYPDFQRRGRQHGEPLAAVLRGAHHGDLAWLRLRGHGGGRCGGRVADVAEAVVEDLPVEGEELGGLLPVADLGQPEEPPVHHGPVQAIEERRNGCGDGRVGQERQGRCRRDRHHGEQPEAQEPVHRPTGNVGQDQQQGQEDAALCEDGVCHAQGDGPGGAGDDDLHVERHLRCTCSRLAVAPACAVRAPTPLGAVGALGPRPA